MTDNRTLLDDNREVIERTLLRVSAERDALRAENKELKALNDVLIHPSNLDALRAENERLHQQRIRLFDERDRLEAENERLRAALERIGSYGKWELTEDDAYSMQRIAADALVNTKRA